VYVGGEGTVERVARGVDGAQARLGGGVAIVAGFFASGRLADRVPKPTNYTIACGLGFVACAVLAHAPRSSAGYAATTLFNTFTLGMVTALFAGPVFAIIGDTAAQTKINLFFALDTLRSLGMLRVAGWAHDAWSTSAILYTEALVGMAALAVCSRACNRHAALWRQLHTNPNRETPWASGRETLDLSGAHVHDFARMSDKFGIVRASGELRPARAPPRGPCPERRARLPFQ
jgi:hypothetical protein